MTLHIMVWLLSLLCGLAVAPQMRLVAAQDWIQWRGPNRDGHVIEFNQPAVWPEKLKLKWRSEVGAGYSSPVVAQDKAYIHTRVAGREVMSCLDIKTGKLLWRESYPVPSIKNSQNARSEGEGPYSTPVLYRGRLYTLGITAILSCFDAETGELKWRKDFSSRVTSTEMFTGTAMSPLLADGFLIVYVGDDRPGVMIALDVESGQERWRWQGDAPSYASPILAELGGIRQVVTMTEQSIVGLSLSSGQLLWRSPFPGERNGSISTPVLYRDLLVFSKANEGTLAVKILNRGGGWSTEEVWRNPKLSLYLNSPVSDGDLLFGLSHVRKGQFFCLNARTGAPLWVTEGREGEQSSILIAGGAIFFLKNDGELIVSRKSDKGFDPIARYQVADTPVWAHPAIWDKHILIKDASTLTQWSLE